MEQKSADELGGVNLLSAPLTVASIVLVAKDDVFAFHAKEPIVGNGDAMGIASEILENRLGPTEGPLGKDDPVSVCELIKESLKCDGMAQFFELLTPLENRLLVGPTETPNESLLEEGGKDVDVNEEIWIGLDPAITLGGGPGTLHDGMDMRVKGRR